MCSRLLITMPVFCVLTLPAYGQTTEDRDAVRRAVLDYSRRISSSGCYRPAIGGEVLAKIGDWLEAGTRLVWRGWGQAPLPQQAERVSFCIGDLAVRHGRLLSLGGEQKTTVCQVTFLLGESCCIYYMNSRHFAVRRQASRPQLIIGAVR